MVNPNQKVQEDPVPEDQRIINIAAKIKKFMVEGLNQISSIATVKNPVMVLGRTGSGKSALINLLAGKPLVSRRNENTGEFFLDSPDMLPGITIGNDQPAETSVPHAWIYNGNTAYWDCPGFDDNRGIEYEITNAFLIKKLFNAYQTCKILIVVSDADLNDIKAINLLSTVRALDLFLRSNIDKSRSGLMLVVSGVNPDKTVKQIQATLQGIIDNPLIALTASQKEIFQVFINNPIIMFKKPVVEGAFDITCAQEHLETIEHLGVINNLRVNLGISAAKRLILLEMYTHLLRSVNLEIDNLMRDLHLQLKNFIANKGSRDLQKLRKVVTDFEIRSAKFDNGAILSNEQILKVASECRQLHLDHNIGVGSLTLNIKTMLDKTETFDFLDQFIDRDAKVKLNLQKTIFEYLSNCTRDTNLTIKAIEQQVEKEKIIALQFELNKKKLDTIAAEKKAREEEAKKEAARLALVNYRPPPPPEKKEHGGIGHVVRKVFGRWW